MKTADRDREIRGRIDSFLTELTLLVKSSALEAVQEALGTPGAAVRAAASARRAPASPRKSGVPSPIADLPAASKRAKRSPEDVMALAETFFAYVQAHPGERLDQIGRGLGIPTRDLKLPVQKLFEAKRIASKGRKRGTSYTAR